MVNSLRKALAVAGIAVGITGAMTTSSHATYSGGSVISDPGTYAPISLGADIVLDACGSSFAGYSLCDLPSTNKFGIEWFILRRNTQYNYNEWLAQYTYHQSQVEPNLQKTIGTGSGTVIDTAGTYFIGLHVISYGDTIALPGGGYAWGGASDWKWSGYFTVSEASVTPPSSVPEPLAALLLLPGFAFIARRDRRRQRKTVTA